MSVTAEPAAPKPRPTGLWARRPQAEEDDPSSRLDKALRQEELAGLSFALTARGVAVAAVALWLIAIVPAPRVFYFLGVVAVFYALGLVPHLIRFHPRARWIKLGFVALDVALIVAVILIPPPFQEEALNWPIQTRLRFPDYLYLLVYLAGSALSYSPLNVISTGLCIIVAWSAGFLALYWRDDTMTFAVAAERGMDLADAGVRLAVFFDPRYVETCARVGVDGAGVRVIP